MQKHKFNIFPKAGDEDFKAIVDDMAANGYDSRQPIHLYQGDILDGWNRYLATQELGIEPEYTEFVGTDEEALNFTIRTNKRRNLSSSQRAAYAAEAEEMFAEIAKQVEEARRAKIAERENVANQHTKKVETCQIIDTSAKPPERATSKAAEVFNTNRTYVSDAQKIKKVAPEVFEKVKSGEMSMGVANQVSKMPEAERKSLFKSIPESATPKEVVEIVKKAHVANNSGNNEWYTPSEYIERARRVMGSIDTDPASNDVAQKKVKAGAYYTEETNGLDKQWIGNVWMNPPYSAQLIGKFCRKLVEEYDNGNVKSAIVLVNNATEAQWFQSLVEVASCVAFTRRRVKFLDPNGDANGAPLQGQAVLYLGCEKSRFYAEFNDICWVSEVMR